MDAKKIAAEAGQPVFHVDCMGEWELSHRWSDWAQLVRVIVCVRRLGSLERQRASQTTSTDTGFGVERDRVILVPARLSVYQFISYRSFSKVVECVDDKRTDSEIRRVKNVERYDGKRFVTPSWQAVAKYPLCQIS